MTDLVIIGSGRHAKVIFSEAIKQTKYNIVGFADNNKSVGEKIVSYNNKYYFNLGSQEDILKDTKSNIQVKAIIGVGHNHNRRKIFNDIKKLNTKLQFESVVSKDAIINSNVKIGCGSFVASGVVINCGTTIGKHCLINTSNSIDHDNYFSDFSSTGPGVITGGNVTIGPSSFIGIGAKIKNNIDIGEFTIIGANSYVNKNCDSRTLYYGSPAKIIRPIEENYNYL